MKIIITGAAGFIGSNLTEYFLNNNWEVAAIDNFNAYYDPRIKEYNIKDFKDDKNFSLARIDLLNKNDLDKFFAEHKDALAIVHLAAWAGVTRSFDEPDLYIRNNIEATTNVMEMSKKHGPKNVIFASTSSVYGDNPTPFAENMTTDFPLAPYPATKKAGEVLMYAYSKYFDINTTILRIFNPNGLRLRPDLAIPKLVKSCLFGTEMRIYNRPEDLELTGRDYCYVGHICEAIEYATLNPFKYEIFNLGNSNPISLKKLIETVERTTGKKATLTFMNKRAGEMEVTYANISKAKQLLNYNPSTSLDELVKMYLNWFVKQEEWYQKVVEV